MPDPYLPPRSVFRDLAASTGIRWWLWSLRAIATYSIVAAIIADVNLVKLFATDSFAQSLPAYVRYFAHFMPGILLAAGMALFFRSKLALWLYVVNLLLTILGPAILYPLYSDPYVTTSLLDIYRRALSLVWIMGWATAAGLAAFVWWLNKRGALS